MIDLLINMGFTDFYDQHAYDRSWIFRSTFGEDIVDVIWGMANHRTEVDTAWIQRGPVVDFEGRPLRLIPVEELIWSKLYVLQKDRCDWPDILNLIGHCGLERRLAPSAQQAWRRYSPARCGALRLRLAAPGARLGHRGSLKHRRTLARG